MDHLCCMDACDFCSNDADRVQNVAGDPEQANFLNQTTLKGVVFFIFVVKKLND